MLNTWDSTLCQGSQNAGSQAHALQARGLGEPSLEQAQEHAPTDTGTGELPVKGPSQFISQWLSLVTSQACIASTFLVPFHFFFFFQLSSRFSTLSLMTLAHLKSYRPAVIWSISQLGSCLLSSWSHAGCAPGAPQSWHSDLLSTPYQELICSITIEVNFNDLVKIVVCQVSAL